MKLIKNLPSAIIIMAVLFWGTVNSQTNTNFLNSNSRAMSMGGAFTSIYDIDNSPMWNPAINILEKDRKLGYDSSYYKAEIDILPAALAAILVTIEFSRDSSELKGGYWQAVGILLVYSFKGYTYSSNQYSMHLKLNEDLVDYKFSHVKKIFDNSHSMLGFSYQLGREFAMGISLNYCQTNIKEVGRKRGLGASAGLSYNALSVNGLCYGLTYFKFPKNMKNVREITERLIDNSVNFGISYNFSNNFLISTDLRNITRSEKSSFCETHLGLEERIFRYKNGDLYLRQGGYFLNNDKDNLVYSFGIGYKSDLSFVKRDKLFNISFGATKNKYQGIRNNLYFSFQISF